MFVSKSVSVLETFLLVMFLSSLYLSVYPSRGLPQILRPHFAHA